MSTLLAAEGAYFSEPPPLRTRVRKIKKLVIKFVQPSLYYTYNLNINVYSHNLKPLFSQIRRFYTRHSGGKKNHGGNQIFLKKYYNAVIIIQLCNYL